MGAVLDLPWDGSLFDPPTPLDIGSIEATIVDRLTSSMDNVEVTHYPDRPESYRLTHRVGAVLVRYDGATYGPLNDAAAVVQKRELRFAMRLMVRDLGWSFGGADTAVTPGAYSLLETIRNSLTGFQIPGCSKMYPVQERFIERDKQGSVWVYESSFAFSTVAVEPSAPDNYPRFVYGVMQEQGGETLAVAAVVQCTFDGFDQIQLTPNLQRLTITGSAGSPLYVQNVDYMIDRVNGVVTRVSGAGIPFGATVSITYSSGEVVIAQASGGGAPTAPSN